MWGTDPKEILTRAMWKFSKEEICETEFEEAKIDFPLAAL